MNRPYFSVIIPTLNEENYLPCLLDDLKKHQHSNLEIIIVDGHSEDKTREIAHNYAKNVPITVYNVEKRNLSYQRNFGAKKAKGEYIILLDADSRIHQDFLLNLKQNIDGNKQLLYLPTLLPQSTFHRYIVLFKFLNFVIEVSQNWNKPFATGGAMIFQKDFFKFLGGYKGQEDHDEKILFPEDHDLMIRAKKAGVKAKVLNNVLVEYSVRRMEKEGGLKAITLYLSAALLMMTQGDMDTTKIKYEMGGHLYEHADRRDELEVEESEAWITDFINEVKKVLSLKD